MPKRYNHRAMQLLFGSVVLFGTMLASACAAALSAPPASYAGPIAEKPQYEVGDYWGISHSTSGYLNARVERIEGDQMRICYTHSAGCDVYTSEANWIEWTGQPYTVPGQPWVGTKAEPYIGWLRFPLFVGKSWTQLYTLWFNFPTPAQRYLKVEVVAYEQVAVPAGTFWAFRLEGSDSGYNIYHRTYWYAPSVRWVVKATSNLPSGNWELSFTTVK